MKRLLLALVLALSFSLPAIAEDPCAGRNPMYCAPRPGPIVVEKIRVRPSGSMATTHDTVISQDGRALVIIRGKTNQSSLSDIQERER